MDKCKVMHLGSNNLHASYVLEDITLGESLIEKDLGVLVDGRLNYSIQCQSAASKATRILSCIKRGMDSRGRDVILPIYEASV